ncbi:hypothetical protein [Bacillus sp. MUM 13]|uniref:hypothetical protein n=1 Tax=Bacillus sp. MUM 13 TaxID=1678001 RepID=UPI0008F55A4F|nr:hypothetical protein [Bacillus sp. MUM 13]OIK08388.1 hypothetical protein BIV59_20180 [Bacillus sp. MUM 13]
MGRLVKIIEAKKHRIINILIAENAYQPSDRIYLSNLPLKNLEEILKYRPVKSVSDNENNS